MEVLAPVGTWASLERAAAAGADAVYLGYTAFGARAGADNFDDDRLRQAIAFAHLHHMRVHVTVNTLVKEEELPTLYELLGRLDDMRADAVLVQDLGVLAIARACFPSLPVHASTQMAIHNLTGVHWCRRMGMTRAVLARECSLSEIRLAAQAGIEVEVFVHGAQCVSVSGECLASSLRGERSGNRGRCAQPCRLRYSFDGKRGAYLSPRDICLRDAIPALMDAGAASVKIEGRLKRPEYVAVVTAQYRKAVDQAAAGTFRPAEEQEKRALRQIFSRGEFMQGYALGDEDSGVVQPEQAAKSGVEAGSIVTVGRDGRVCMQADVPIHPGDELRTGHAEDAGGQYFTYSGTALQPGDRAWIRLPLRSVSPLTRTVDALQMAEAMAMPLPTVPVSMTLDAWPGKPLTLTVTDGESRVDVTGDMVQAAQNRALTEEDARRSLEKSGGTGFSLRGLTVHTAAAFVPVSALNELRRSALEALTAARINAFARKPGPCLPLPELALPDRGAPDMVIFRTAEQLEAVKESGLRLVCFPEDFAREPLEALLASLPAGCWLQLPTVCEEATLQLLAEIVKAHRSMLGGVVLGSVGQLGIDWGLPMGAGSGIPVMNRRAAGLLLDAGCAFVTASSELSEKELRGLMAGHPPIVVPVYGRTQAMLLHHCPARTALGLKQGHSACRLCEEGDSRSLRGKALKDDLYAFPLLRQHLPEGCLVRMMNALPLNVMRGAKADGFPGVMELTCESGKDTAAVMDAWRQGRKTESEKTTSGHWTRPVE